MKYYQHSFDSIEDYLHHRSPYLLVQNIVEISDQKIVAEATVKGDEFFIAGHFPGAPILPGAMMQEMSTQTAGILIAAGDLLTIAVELNEQVAAMFDFSATITNGDAKIMQNSFRLTNILSKTLQAVWCNLSRFLAAQAPHSLEASNFLHAPHFIVCVG